MTPNPLLGVLYHWAGGLAAASFYIPYRAVRQWSWETYWLVGGVFSWIVAPWTIALLLVPDPRGAIQSAPARGVVWAYVFGTLWGLGGLTFGLTMRYLGIALGVAVALGLCNAFGTLMPPIFSGEFGEIVRSRSGQVILLGVVASLVGIAVCGAAGMSKERELSSAQKHAAIPEFDFGKGMIVATFSGVMSACFAYGLAAGQPVAEAARQQLIASGQSELWQNLPVLIVGPGRRLHDESRLVRGPEPEERERASVPERARSPGRERDHQFPVSAPSQLSLLSARGPGLVSAVLLLQHGRRPDGPLRLFELDPPYGEHHHLQHALGHRTP